MLVLLGIEKYRGFTLLKPTIPLHILNDRPGVRDVHGDCKTVYSLLDTNVIIEKTTAFRSLPSCNCWNDIVIKTTNQCDFSFWCALKSQRCWYKGLNFVTIIFCVITYRNRTIVRSGCSISPTPFHSHPEHTQQRVLFTCCCGCAFAKTVLQSMLQSRIFAACILRLDFGALLP